MGIEIERKFLVIAEKLPEPLPKGEEFHQGYLASQPTVRVRIVDDAKAWLTIKGPGMLERAEFEYEIPVEDGRELMKLASKSLRKNRRKLGRFELDWFPSLNLWLAEIELKYAEEPFVTPPWLGKEVTGDPSYSNSRLASPHAQG